jgi:oxygen-independent coproporphyrinogen-3 oxidase
MLEADDILRLAGSIRECFKLDEDCGFAVEIDARTLDAERVQAFLAAGVTRASFGVQDFDLAVQDAINRHQSFEQTRSAIEAFRSAGVGSINVDVLYGLPHQSRQSVDETIGKVISLAPDRIALFGYAHVPQKISRQKMIPTKALPDAVKRFGLANHMASALTAAGYVRIGLDHFARPNDELAQALARHDLRRNFQGYTVDDADVLIGLGASSIGRLPQGYIQNAVQTGDYARRIAEHGLAAVRGYAFTADDEMRAFAIERLMCDLAFPAEALQARYGAAAAELLAEAASLVEADTDGLVEKGADGFRVTERGRPFVRSICAVFDAHLGLSEARYSSGV